MLNDMQNRQLFVGIGARLPNKRPKKLDEKEIVKTIYYEEQSMEISYV